MSTIITWTAPESLYNPVATYAKLWRNGVCINSNIPFNIAEDEDNVVSSIYTVTYHDKLGAMVGQLQPSELAYYVRPVNSCRINFALTQPNGMPSRTEIVQVNSRLYNTYCDRLVTNYNGETFAILLHGAAVNILLPGSETELQCVVPVAQTLNYNELTGSIVQTERRGRL